MRFYVYELIDPFTDAVFYVGKGQKSRMYHHVAEAAKGTHSRKCERIRAILSFGGQIKYNVASRHEDENEALQAEFDKIAEYGLDSLTNVVSGGKMGAQVYLRRLAEAKDRQRLSEHEELRRGLVKISPQMATMLKAKSQGKQFGAWVGGRWLDFTSAFDAFLSTLIEKLGLEVVAAELAPYGVVIEAEDGRS